MQKEQKLKWLTIGCILSIAVVYTAALVKIFPEPAYYTEYHQWMFYWWYMIWDVAAVHVAFGLWKNFKLDIKTVLRLLTLVAMIILQGEYFLYHLLLMFWPFAMLALAKSIRQRKITFGIDQWKMQDKSLGELWGSLVYYGLLATGMMVIRVIGPRYMVRDLVMIGYLLAVTCAAWICSSENWKSFLNPLNLIFLIVMIRKFFDGNYRVEEIISSLEKPMTAITGARHEMIWLGNRMEMMGQVWLGWPITLKEQMENTCQGVSMVMIKQLFGSGGVILTVLLEGILIFLLYRLYRNHLSKQTGKKWYRMALVSIIIWCVIALAAQVVLIAATRVEPLFMGRTEMLAMVLLFIHGKRSCIDDQT